MITVTSEPRRRLVRAQMGGLLTIEDVQAFSQEEQRAVRDMGLRSGEFDLLVVTLGNVVQTQEVMQAFAVLMTSTPAKARKIAVVRDGALTRMQSRRVSGARPNYQVFDNVDDADTWLREA